VVLLLVVNDCRDGCYSLWITRTQRLHLVLEVSKNDTLNGNGGCRNGSPTKQSGDEAQNAATSAAKHVAAAAPAGAALQFRMENCPMPLLVAPEFGKFLDQIWRREPSHEDLTRVDVDRAMFAGVVDLDEKASYILR
jgi:hypothetical protein